MQPTTNIVTNLMWPIVLLGGLGVFIDFVLGAAGQRRVKEWMTEWWVRFEDTDWQSFSNVEAQFFIGLSDRLFGQRLLSRRRFRSCAIVLVACYALSLIHELVELVRPFEADSLREILTSALTVLIDIVMDAMILALSLSLTRAISVIAVKAANKIKTGPLVFSCVILFHAALAIVWRPLVEISVGFIKNWPYLHSVGVSTYDVFKSGITNVNFFPIADWIVWSASYSFRTLLYSVAQGGGGFVSLFANCMRLFISILVLTIVVLGRWLRPTLSLIWRRLIEDQKGIFTLVLGALGALAGILREVANRF